VLVVGEEAPGPARVLAASSQAEVEQIRGVFAHLGTAVSAPVERARLASEVYARAAAELSSERAELDALRRAEVERLDAELQKLRGTLAWTERKLDEMQRSAPWRIGHAITSVRRFPAKAMHVLGVLARVVWWAATFQLRAGLRRRRQARVIRRSGLFQPEHYLGQLRDPRRARRDPIWHFLVHGAAAGLDPNPFFATLDYVARHPDAAAGGENPLVHYVRSGGRSVDPGPRFDVAFYLARFPEVAASGENPLAYYLARGATDGQICHPSMLPEARARALADDLLARADALAPPQGPPRTLVVDHRMPMPDHDSGSVRMFALVRLLRELGHEVTFASDSAERHPRYEADLLHLGVGSVYGFAAIAAHLEREGHRYRFVVLSRPEVADRWLAVARAHALHAKVVYDTVDLHWVRFLRGAEATGNASLRFEAERFRVVERLLARSADLVLAITPEEKEALLAEAPGARVEVVPNVHACRPPSTPWAQRAGLMFIGGFEHVPNLDAVEWFVGSVLPLVQRELPGIVLRVVGSKAPESLRRLASAAVRIEGHVPDPTSLFEQSRVFVSPLRYGAGMKGKIGHAMSHGLPVVTTSVGAEGMRLTDGENTLVADGAAAFAAAVVRLHEDELLWSKLSRASVQHVQQRFSEDAVRATLASLFPADGRARMASPR
jgi:glycosyltransferase involved in cell wall biosynthesis